MNDTPDTLMVKISKGDKIAFRTLATQFSGAMFGLAYRLMGNHAANAEDAVQDALIKVWVSAPNYRSKGRAESYILTIVHRCCMDLYRKQRAERMAPDTALDQMVDPAASPEAVYQDRQSRDDVMERIDILPDRQREAVLLSYFQGYSHRHIADILAVSEKAVESLLVRARVTLGESFEKRPSSFSFNIQPRPYK